MKEPRHSARILLILVVLATSAGLAEESDPSRLTLERLYGSSEFHGEGFGGRWFDATSYTTLERSNGPVGGRDIVRHDLESGEREVLVPAAHLVPPGESSPLGIDEYDWSEDRSLLLVYTSSKRVWRRNTRGDYWVLDRSSRELRKLGGDAPPSSLMFAKLSPTGTHVAYVHDNDIWLEDLRGRDITQLTTDGSDDIVNGTFDWVYEEELGLRDGFRWSPDGRWIAYWQLDTSGVREFHMINNVDSLYPTLTTIRYPKVGEQNSAARVGVVSIEGGETRWIELPGDPRDNYVARLDWAPGGDEIVLQQLNRLQNTNRVALANALTGKVRTVLVDRDDAWVDVGDDLRWLADGKRFTWVSERDGWRHVWIASREGGEPSIVTPGEYDVIDLLAVDERDNVIYFIASPADPTRRSLYRVRLDGTGLERITPESAEGTHSYRVSPDARHAFHTFSTADTPPVTDIVRLPGHERVRVLVDNEKLRKRVEKLARRPTEFFRVDIGEGVELDAWCLLPPDLDPEKRYPLLVYVYGEPAGQTVLDRWTGRGGLWHLMLAQRGWVVMSFDNRGTPAPRGRAWRKSVYRQVGVLAPKDQAAAVRRVLATRRYLDADRVGVWGWSGGGSMTLNAMFKYPELYHTGISIAPVPNQRYYDTIYQERYMGLPRDNVDGFREGSPINFAHRLEGHLLVVHGTADDNVHYQGTEALVDELIRHNRPFTMMAYPNRRHGIHEGPNTTRHLRALMLRFLEHHLPPGPR